MDEWISLNEYMRRYKMGYKAVLKLIHEGKVEAQKIGSRYKIRVGGNTVSMEMYEKILRENAELKILIKNLKTVLNTTNI